MSRLLRALLVILMLVSQQSRAYAEDTVYKTSKWQLLTDSHWELTVVNNQTKEKVKISVFSFSDDIVLISTKACENAKGTTDKTTVTLSSKKRTFYIRSCVGDSILGSTAEEQLIIIREQLQASKIPTEVLNMLQLLPL